MDDILEADASFSPIRWESLTSEQLQDMARGGFAAGEFGAGAHREIERRARECARLERQADRRVAFHKKLLRIGMLSGVEIAMLVGLVAFLLLR